MHLRLGLALATTLIAAPVAAQQQSPLDALGGSLWPRGGASDSNAGGRTGAGVLDGTVRFDFGSGFTFQGEGQGSAYGGSDGKGGKVQFWWADEALGLAGAFAETAERNALLQRRLGARGELYLGPLHAARRDGLRGRRSRRHGPGPRRAVRRGCGVVLRQR